MRSSMPLTFGLWPFRGGGPTWPWKLEPWSKKPWILCPSPAHQSAFLFDVPPLSDLFRIHKLTDSHERLVMLWLTRKMTANAPPTKEIHLYKRIKWAEFYLHQVNRIVPFSTRRRWLYAWTWVKSHSVFVKLRHLGFDPRSSNCTRLF